jgi:hypothetical protein
MARYTFEEADKACLLANSYSRMNTILTLRRHMSAPDWWRLLGENWNICDNIAAHKHQLRPMLLKANPTNLRSMMQTHELRALAAMPDEITVYRGCYEVNRDGLSWSLSPTIAAGFTSLNRYIRKNEAALLLTGKVSKARVVLSLGRNEREVICPVVEVTHERQIT